MERGLGIALQDMQEKKALISRRQGAAFGIPGGCAIETEVWGTENEHYIQQFGAEILDRTLVSSWVSWEID